MENKFFKIITKSSITIVSIILCLQLMSCEDDAVLEPELIKECKPGDSYCNLFLPDSENLASTNFKNPKIF